MIKIVSSNHKVSRRLADLLRIHASGWRHAGSSDQLRGVGTGHVILIEEATYRNHPHYTRGLMEIIENTKGSGAQVIRLSIDLLR